MARTSQPWDHGEGLTERIQGHSHPGPRQRSDCSLLIFRPLERLSPASAGSQDGAGDPLSALAERIRPHIRRTDTIELDKRNALAVILHAASREGARAVFQRLHELLTIPPSPDYAAFAFVIGYATSTVIPGQECVLADIMRDAWKPRTLLSIALPPTTGELAPNGGKPKLGASHPQMRKSAAEAHPAVAPAESDRRSLLRLVTRDPLTHPADESLRERARALGIPFVQLPSRLPASSRGAIAPELSRELKAVPIGRSRNTLTVAMHDPCDDDAILRLRDATGLAIFPVLAAPDQLARALRQLARG